MCFCRVGNLLIGFSSTRAIRSWKRANSSRRSFVMSDLSELIMVTLVYRAMGVNCSSRSLKKSASAMSKEHPEWIALDDKKWEKLSKTYKKRIFPANHSFFASYLIESRANHSHHFFLKSDERNLLFCKERCEWIACDSFMVALCKELRERIAHGRSLKWGILSERSKSERVNSQTWPKLRKCETGPMQWDGVAEKHSDNLITLIGGWFGTSCTRGLFSGEPVLDLQANPLKFFV